MPRYTVILQAADGTKARRQILIRAVDAESAKAAVEAREEGFALFRMTTDEWAEAEAVVDALAADHDVAFAADASLPDKVAALKQAGVKVHPTIRANVVLHQQAKPYKVVSVQATDEPATDPEGGEN